LRIFFGDDGGLWIGVVSGEVVFELERDDVVGMRGDHGQEGGVGLVGERIASWLDDETGIEIAVGDVAIDGVEVGEDAAQTGDGAVDALDVQIFCVFVWTLDGEQFESAYLGKDEEESRIKMTANAGFFTIGLPVIVGGCLNEVFGEDVQIRTWSVGRKVLFVEYCFGAGDVRKEAAHSVPVDTDRGFFGADDIRQLETIGFKESFTQERQRNLEADELCVGGGSEAEFAELVDVEGKLSLDVGVGVLSVVDGGSISLFQLGELDGDGEIDCGAVTDGVAYVVREGADGEGELIGSLCVVQERENEVAGADVVGEVGEELVAEGIVAEVLNGAAAVGVAVSLLELGFGEGRESLEEERANGLFPGEVDEFLMGLDRIRNSGRRREEQSEEGCRFKQDGAAGGRNRSSSFLCLFRLYTLYIG
jgi:hypothetical protein